jgi:hypothetical protein
VSVARGEQGHNPYSTITETCAVILEQRERISFLQSALNDVYLHPSTTVASSNFIQTVLLADGGDDDDEDDVNDLGRLHSVTIARFDNNDDDEDKDGGDDDDKD